MKICVGSIHLFCKGKWATSLNQTWSHSEYLLWGCFSPVPLFHMSFLSSWSWCCTRLSSLIHELLLHWWNKSFEESFHLQLSKLTCPLKIISLGVCHLAKVGLYKFKTSSSCARVSELLTMVNLYVYFEYKWTY